MSGFTVSPEELTQAASTLRSATGEIQAMADYTQEADPDPETWGLCGIPMGLVYFGLAELYRHVLGECSDALEGVADGIEACGEDYASCDDELSASIDKAGAEIDGVAV